MKYACFAVGGFLIGTITMYAIQRYIQPVLGTLRIDRSNPEKEKWRFDIDELDNLANRKRITLLIDNNADLSQK